jgi:hypothetical protein
MSARFNLLTRQARVYLLDGYSHKKNYFLSTINDIVIVSSLQQANHITKCTSGIGLKNLALFYFDVFSIYGWNEGYTIVGSALNFRCFVNCFLNLSIWR